MTRKDYERIARALKNSRPAGLSDANSYKIGAQDQWNNTLAYVANELQAENELFKRAAFYAAAGGLF